jgi:predicted dehydrogenase
VNITVEDLASVLLRFDNGARGSFSVGQVCAGHKNDLQIEVSGGSGSVKWRQEQQNELWIGRRDAANSVLQKDPALVGDVARAYAHLPGGHQESWADAFCNRDARHLRRHRVGTRHVAAIAAGVRDICRRLSCELPGGRDARERYAWECVGQGSRGLARDST